PKHLPSLDYPPSLHARRYIFVDLGNDTFRPYLNSVIVASFSTVLALIIGSMAAYALSRIQYRPSVGSVMSFILLLAGVVIAVALAGIDWRVAIVAALALFFLALRALGPRFRRRL